MTKQSNKNRTPNCVCALCGKDVYKTPTTLKSANSVTCSRECRSLLNKKLNGDYFICQCCGKSFYKKKSRFSKLNFCSRSCKLDYKKIKCTDDEIIKLHNDGMYDHEISNKFNCSRSYISIRLKKLGYTNRRSKISDVDLRLRISNTNKGTRTGNLNHKFKGDSELKSLARGLFNSISKMFMIKNDYTCKLCSKKGGDLNVHHIKPF